MVKIRGLAGKVLFTNGGAWLSQLGAIRCEVGFGRDAGADMMSLLLEHLF
jgi:hypothetical protein